MKINIIKIQEEGRRIIKLKTNDSNNFKNRLFS